MKKLYLIHPVTNTVEFTDTLRLTEELEDMGFGVYSPINILDVKDDVPLTPSKAYMKDISEMLDSDIVIIKYDGSVANGVELEIGILLGLYEARYQAPEVYIYTACRKEIQYRSADTSAIGKFNRMALGGIERYFNICDDEATMMDMIYDESSN